MNSAVTPILTFLEGSKQFVIPIYQRTYEWKREQCSQFWEDILSIGGSPQPKPHFFGSIVLHGSRRTSEHWRLARNFSD